MATSYNFEILRKLPAPKFPGPLVDRLPIVKIVFGALGFTGILGSLILLFARLLKEMKISQIQADFLDRISHELRTPLSTLTLVSDLLRSEAVTPQESQQLWRSHQLELSRLKMDVELLLQAAKMRESKIKPKLEVLNLESWLTERWANFKLILGPNAKMERVGAALQTKVEVDSALLEMIIRNLLDNARKFSLDQPAVHFRGEIFQQGFLFKTKKWRLEVVDEGLGFQPEQKGKLFKRFSRLTLRQSQLKPNSVPGTGLGLYLSAMASKSMGLTLVGESLGEGKGAKFKIEGKCL